MFFLKRCLNGEVTFVIKNVSSSMYNVHVTELGDSGILANPFLNQIC